MRRRHKTSSAPLPMRALAVVVIVLVLGILLAVLFGPDKPKAPPTSVVTFQSRPERNEAPVQAILYDDGEVIRAAPTLEEDAADEFIAVQQRNAGREARPFVIKGVVRSAKTGEPIIGANVFARREWTQEEEAQWQALDQKAIVDRNLEAFDKANEQRRALRENDYTRTNTRGRFVLRLEKEGNYRIQAQKNGYLDTVLEGEPLGAARAEREIAIEMSIGASIAGRVTESGRGKGVAGLRIQVTGVESRSTLSSFEEFFNASYYYDREAITDEDGYYIVGGLEPGEFAARIDLRKSEYKPGRVLPYQHVLIFSPDQEVEHVDFQVEVGGVVWGYVQTPEGESVEANAILTTSKSVVSQFIAAAVSALTQQTLPITGSTESGGYYELLGVPLNGEYRVLAQSDDRAPVLSKPFLLTESRREVRVDIVMFEGTTVWGRVVEPNGDPVSGASVFCMPGYTALVTPMYSALAVREARSDPDGYFEIADLPEGAYQVFAEANREGYKMSLTGTSIYPDGYQDIENLRIVLEPVDEGDYSIYGNVADYQSGGGIADARVTLGGLGTESFNAFDREVFTDRHGDFLITGVETGMYMMEIGAEGYASAFVSEVRLEEATQVFLERAALVTGIVFNGASKQPYAGNARVTASLIEITSSANFIEMLEGESGSTSTEEDGTFSLSLGAGTYRLEASAPEFAPARAEITVEPGGILSGVELYLSASGATIEGFVVTGDGGSPQGARVSLIEAGSAGEAFLLLASLIDDGGNSTRVGSDGYFYFDRLPPGEYDIIAEHAGYARGHTGLFRLGEEESIPDIEVRLGLGGGLEGYIYRDGRPVTDVMIALISSGTPHTTTVNEEGYYYLDGLAEGTYQVTVVPMNPAAIADLRGGTAEVTEGAITRLDFGSGTGTRIEGYCDPPPTIIGRVHIRPMGSPVPAQGELVDWMSFAGTPAIILPDGSFVLEDIQPGEWQLDVLYTQGFQARYVHSEFIVITGEEEVVPVELSISLR